MQVRSEQLSTKGFHGHDFAQGAGNLYGTGRLFTGDFGNILYQEEGNHLYKLRYYYCMADSRAAISCIETGDAPFLFFNLKRDAVFNFGGAHNSIFHERGFNILYSPATSGKIFLEPGRQYAFFSIHFPVETIENRQQGLQHQIPFKQAIAKKLPSAYVFNNCPADHTLMKLVSLVLYTTGDTDNYLAGLQEIMSGLVGLAQEKLLQHNRSVRFTNGNADAEPVYKVKELLHTSLDKCYSLAAYAQQVHISAEQLKAGFWQIYGMSFFDFQRHFRMERAMNLILHTPLSYEAIAAAVGYKSVTSFFNKFKLYYHNTPKYFRDGR